jgi:mannitol-specific phosphotransferase system IIBC component
MKQNALSKAAEDSMASYGSAMEAKRDEAKQAMYNASAQLSSNQVSTLGAISGAMSAGMGGYMMGSSITSAKGTGRF